MNTETPVFRPQKVSQTPAAPSLPLTEWRLQGAWRGGLTAAYASAKGGSHARNEDCCSHVPSAERPDFCGVADGVGGGAHGEIASSVLLNHCARAPKEARGNPARLVEWLARADGEVREAIARRTDQAGAATLAAAWFPSRGTAYVLNVGDCRVYQLRPGRITHAIQRLTIDQTYASLAQEPPPNGKPDDPARMVGAGAVGTPPVVKAQIRERDLLLLCSDGVHKFVPDDQIAQVISEGLADKKPLDKICDALVRAAKANGSQDDASALLVMRRPWFIARWIYGWAVVAILLLGLVAGSQIAFAETRSIIDPTESPEPPPLPAPSAKKPSQQDTATKRERIRSEIRAEEGQRKRAKAAARAAERAAEGARQEAAAREAAVREASAKAAAAREAAAREATRKATAARIAATRAAAAKATNARIAAEREAVAREATMRQAAAREVFTREAARELAAREAAREAALREAAKEAAALKEAAAREAAEKDAAAREASIREASIREASIREAASRDAAAREATRQAAARETAAGLAANKLLAARGGSLRPAPRFGTVFRDCTECPELVWLPQGDSFMGEASGGPRSVTTIDYPLAVGRFEVTFAEWDACVSAGECRRRPRDSGWGRGRQPVIDVSWQDARQYTAWLARRTGKTYRLLTEAEWEYAARAGTDARYWWGDESRPGAANCNDCGSRWDGRRPAPVGSFAPNPFGLFDMHGNVWEWVEDCSSECGSLNNEVVVRGGAWQGPARAMRSAARSAVAPAYHDNRIGFRIARTH